MSRVFLSLGSNLGDRLSNIQQAVSSLSMSQHIKIVKTSSFYETHLKNDPLFKNVPFLNTDNEASQIAGTSIPDMSSLLQAGKNIRTQLIEHIDRKKSFIYELTGSGKTHLFLMDTAKEKGFQIATVFIGLICIIALCSILGAICKVFVKDLPDLGMSGKTISSAPIISAASRTRLKSNPSPNSHAELSKILKLPIPFSLSLAKKLNTSGCSKTL